MTDQIEGITDISVRLAERSIKAAMVALPESPNVSGFGPTESSIEAAASIGLSEEDAIATPLFEEAHHTTQSSAEVKTVATSVFQSPERKLSGTKAMSPEKAALAAMFDSIKMPPPVSPSKSPRKASGSIILSSPSKQVVRDGASAAVSLFRKDSSPSTSPSKVASTDSAASRHFSGDSPFRRPVVFSSSSSPGKRLGESDGANNVSTPLSPVPTSSSASNRPSRMRPSLLASSSSPSARLSDLTLNLDTTGTQELIFNQDASFLAAAADVTIDDSFDVSRAKARLRSASGGPSAIVRRSSPAKFGGYKAKPRCSMVPEDDVAEIKPRSPSKRSTLGSRGLGVGRVVKNAAGDDTIELNLTGSFIGNSSIIGGNLMDESAEASLLLGNSFSISRSHLPKRSPGGVTKEPEGKKGKGSDDDDDEEEEGEDYEMDAQNMQKWAAEAARKAQLERLAADKTPSRTTVLRTGSSTVTRVSVASATIAKPVSRVVPRSSLVTPTATSRLLKPRASGIAMPALPRSGSASGLSCIPTPTATAPSTQLDHNVDTLEARTPMRSRRKSTFTTSRPPVSGPARRRESLAASAIVQSHPIPPLPPLGSTTPDRAGTASTHSTGLSPGMKTPTATRRIPAARSSLTGRTVIPTPRASAPGTAVGAPSRVGGVAQPRTSLTATTPTSRVATARSVSLATTTSRTATARSSAAAVGATPGAIRRSTSQPQDLAPGETARPRTVPRASLASRPSLGGPARTGLSTRVPIEKSESAPMQGKVEVVSKIAVAGTRRPSIGGGFGFKPRTSAVYVGRGSLLDGEDKEN